MELLTNIATVLGMFEIIVVIGTLGLFVLYYSLMMLRIIYNIITGRKE